MPKREHFGGLFGTFSGTGAKSENGALAWVPASFRGFQGTLKSSIFHVFSGSASSTIPEGTLGRTFEDFYRFLRILGSHWAPIWHHFPQKVGSETDSKKSWFLGGTVAGRRTPGWGWLGTDHSPRSHASGQCKHWRGVSTCPRPSRHHAQLDYDVTGCLWTCVKNLYSAWGFVTKNC